MRGQSSPPGWGWNVSWSTAAGNAGPATSEVIVIVVPRNQRVGHQCDHRWVTDTPRAPLVLLAACVFFAISTEMLPVGLLPQIGRGLGVSASAAGVLVSLYAVLVAVMSVPIAAVVERWPRRGVLAVLLGAYTLSNVVFAVAPNYAVAVVARAIGGLAHAGFFAVAIAAAVSLVDVSRSGRALTVVMTGNALALVLGVPLGTVLGTALGWRWSFVVLAAVLAVLAVAVLRVLPAQAPLRSSTRTSVLTGVRRPAVLIVATVITLLALGHFTLYTYISPLLLHDGVAHADVGAALFGYGCGGLLGLAVAGAAVARRPDEALAVDIVLMILSLVLAATVASTIGIVAVITVWGVAFGAFPTLTQSVMLRAAGDATNAATALVNATTNIGIAGGALLGSRLLGVIAVPELGWVGAGIVALSLVVYVGRLRRADAR
jgi:DHA1 family inner membrane transport protein